MLQGLNSLVDQFSEPLGWERLASDIRQRFAVSDVGWVAAWEIQSYLATLALVAIVSFMSPLAALAVMTCWSMVAAVAYWFARGHGMPNLLDEAAGADTSPQVVRFTAGLLHNAVRAWLCGANALVYTRTACRVLARPAVTPASKLLRLAVMGLGMTLFGVSAVDHILRRAGYSGGKLLRLSLLGPLLNVPYRVLISALVVNAVTGIGSHALGATLSVLP